MKVALSVLIFVGALVLCASYALAQTPIDPSGHWKGVISAPFGEVAVELDVRRTDKGQLAVTFTQPSQNVSGMPVREVTLDGRLLMLTLPGGGRFTGTVFADGKTYSGDFAVPQGTAPFTLTRTGDAHIVRPVTGKTVGKDLEGRWSGTLDVNGRQLRVVLIVANRADGTSLATMLSLDEGGIELPVVVEQEAARVTVRVTMNGATYSAVIEGDQMTGRYDIQNVSLPLTLKRLS